MMTDELNERLDELKAKRKALVDQLLEADVSSATISAGSGSKSYTNRAVSELQAKIRICDREIARVEAALGLRPSPGSVIGIYPRYIA